MKTIENGMRFDASDAAQFRLHVLEHGAQFGWKSACAAFGVGKSTYYEWRAAYHHSNHQLVALVRHKTRPHRVRTMSPVDYRLSLFIKRYRKTYGNVDLRKIKVLFDA
jgi:hypothetical protein